MNSGIIKTVAKGARRPKSPFAGKVDLFYLCEIEVHPSKKSDLHILKELAVVESRFGLRRSYQQTLAASYFVKLIDKSAEPETPIPQLNDLLNRGLNYLNTDDIDMRALLHFEKQLVSILGIADPEIEPVKALCDHFYSLPEQREELVKKLQP